MEKFFSEIKKLIPNEYEEFLRLCADTRLGGILSGKAGIINIHLGDSPRKMDMIIKAI